MSLFALRYYVGYIMSKTKKMKLPTHLSTHLSLYLSIYELFFYLYIYILFYLFIYVVCLSRLSFFYFSFLA